MKSILTAFAGNNVFANILFLLILISGFFAVNSMVRESIPEMSLDIISITVSYPGADPEEVEEGVCRKIEELLDGMEGIKQYTTSSSENRGSVTIEVKQGYDVDETMEKIRTKVDAISTFPDDAERPITEQISIQRRVMSLYLTGDMSERRLKVWAEEIKDEIQDLPEITKVSIFGTRDYEINIELSEQRLREYGLTFSQVTDAVRRSNMNMAGGTIRTQGEEIRVRTLGRKYTGEDLSKIVIIARPGGEIITLDRIAVIDDGFTQDPVRNKVDGRPAVILSIYNTLEEDALIISRAVRDYMDKKEPQLPPGNILKILYDETGMLRSRIDLLISNGLIGLLIVFALLWLFMDRQVAFWSGMGIPISLAGAMVVLWGIGGTINMISLFGFILVLGIVVDDAIVVGEAIYVHRKNGAHPIKAAVEGIWEVGLPIIAAVLTTVVAFFPLLKVEGPMGKMIFILPVVVIACLLTSLVECLILLPAHLNNLPDPNGNASKGISVNRLGAFQRFMSNGMERFVKNLYSPFLKQVLEWRYVSLLTAASLFLITLGLIRGGVVEYVMFPPTDGFILTATAKFPEGTTLEATQTAIDRIEGTFHRISDNTETLSGEPLIEHSIAIAGQTFDMGTATGPNLGAVQVILLPSDRRGINSNELSTLWEREVGVIPGIESLTFTGGGMHAGGAPIELWVQGENMERMLAASEEIMERLRRFEGVYQVSTDFAPGKNEMRLGLKPEARGFGLTVDDLARQVYAGYFGNEAVRIQRGSDDIKVKVRYTEEERSRLSDLERIRIRTPDGYEVPLFSVAEISYGTGYSTIKRTDGKRRIEVSAEVDNKKTNARKIMGELSKGFLEQVRERYPDLNISIQGDQRHSAESFESLKIGYPMAVMGIFIIIATIFRSYIQPFIILLTIPFGTIGAIFGHLVMGYELTMISLFGIVALSGVVVNDAIVLIDRINKNLSKGMPFLEAVRAGSARRFRAVFLTSVSTVGALMPLILETDFQARMLIPMAISLAAGVVFATLLTLLLIPSLLVILNDTRMAIHRLKNGRWPGREEVEPAFDRDKVQIEGEKQKRIEPGRRWDSAV